MRSQTVAMWDGYCLQIYGSDLAFCEKDYGGWTTDLPGLEWWLTPIAEPERPQ